MDRINPEDDKRCVKRLIQLEMLTDIDPRKFDIKNGLIVVPCSDGHQFRDAYNHIADICKEEWEIDCVHPVALNGGALLMGGNLLPEKRRRHGEVMVENVLEACEIKKTKSIHLYTHTSCAVAGGIGLGVLDQGMCLMASKQRLKQEDPSLRISCFFHTYEQNGDATPKRRTYFMPKEMWSTDSLMTVLHDFKGMCASR